MFNIIHFRITQLPITISYALLFHLENNTPKKESVSHSDHSRIQNIQITNAEELKNTLSLLYISYQQKEKKHWVHINFQKDVLLCRKNGDLKGWNGQYIGIIKHSLIPIRLIPKSNYSNQLASCVYMAQIGYTDSILNYFPKLQNTKTEIFTNLA